MTHCQGPELEVDRRWPQWPRPGRPRPPVVAAASESLPDPGPAVAGRPWPRRPRVSALHHDRAAGPATRGRERVTPTPAELLSVSVAARGRVTGESELRNSESELLSRGRVAGPAARS